MTQPDGLRTAQGRRIGWIEVPGADPAAAERLRVLLADDFELVDASEGVSDLRYMVAILPPAPGGCSDEEVIASLDKAGDRLIPVVFGSRASTLLPTRSQIVRQPGDERQAARRVAALVALGGHSLVEVNALTASARRWDENGRRAADLLGADTTASAPTLVAQAAQSDHPELDLLSRFVTASDRRQRGIRRRRWILSAATAAVLIIVGTVSAVQKVNADRAAADSREKTAAALANRLSSQVLGLLADHPDPDVTWATALAALEAQPNEQSIRAAQLVRAAIPRHRSIALDRVAIAVSGAENGSFVLRFRDSSAQVRGQDLEVWREAEQVGQAVVSGDGSRLALIGSVIRLNSAAAQRFPETADVAVKAPGTVLQARWAGDDLWLLTASGVYSVTGTEVHQRLAGVLPGWLGSLRGFDLSADGSRLALVGAGGVVVVDQPTGTVRFAKRSTTLHNAVLSTDAAVLYLHDRSLRVTTVKLAADKPTENGARSVSLLVRRLGDVIVTSVQTGQLCPVTPPATMATGCPTAHTGSVYDAAAVGPNGYVSVGQDGFLRLWETLNSPSYPWPTVNAADSPLFAGTSTPKDRASRRSRIEFDRDSNELHTLTEPMGMFISMTPEFQPRWRLFLGIPLGGSWWALAPGGRYLGRMQDNSSTRGGQTKASVLDLGASIPAGVSRLSWSAPAVKQLRATAAVSADGQDLVSAAPRSAYAWRNGARTFGHASPGDPVGTVFGPAGPRVYFSNGHWLDSSNEIHDFESPLLAITGAVGEDGQEHLAWVTHERTLMESVGGRTRKVATLPAGLPVYALKYSDRLSRIALFADQEAAVLRLTDGVLLYASRDATERGTVQDVAFLTEDRMVSIENSGGLRPVDLLTPEALTDELRGRQPRQLDADERAVFGLTEG